MDYGQLCLLLQEYEGSQCGNCLHPVPVPPHSFVGVEKIRPVNVPGHCCTSTHGNVQYAALDSSTSARGDLPVVVAVGVNYTQKQEELPHACTALKSVSNLPWIEDTIPFLMRQRLVKFVQSARSNPALWRARGLLENDVPLQVESELAGYHLVLTNLCPWITTDGWGELNALERNGLIDNPPGGKVRYGPNPSVPQHVADLYTTLSQADANMVLWVGHTLTDERRFKRLFKAMRLPVPWIITANLASPWPWRFP